MLGRKVYNNDDITFFSVLMIAKPECDNVLQAATHYHTRAWQTLIHKKECFILLIKTSFNNMRSCLCTESLQKIWVPGILKINDYVL